MKIAYYGNHQPKVDRPWSTETHVAAAFEELGCEVLRIQENDVAARYVPLVARGYDVFLWTRTWHTDLDEGVAMLDALRADGIVTVGFHLDRWWGLLREPQVLEEPFFRCLPGWQPITTGSRDSVMNVTRRWYAGELVRVRAGEHEITATPNHPVLTLRGWVPLGEVKKGDHLLSGTGRDRAGASRPQIDHPQVMIEQVFEAASQVPDSLAVSRQRVRGVVMDFHGDGADSEVDVVRADDPLALCLQPELAEQYPDLSLFLARAAEVHGPQPRPVELAGVGTGNHRLFASRAFHSRLGHDPVDGGWGHSQRVGDPSDRLALGVPVDDVGTNRVPTTTLGLADGLLSWAAGNVGSNERLVNAADGTTGALGDLLQRFPGVVAPTEVSDVERYSWSGHVYNLGCAEGAYLADGLVTHNCDHLFTADGGHDADYAAVGVNHHWLPPGVHKPECVPGVRREQLAVPVGFVGSFPYPHPEWRYRNDLVHLLRRRYGQRFGLWGQGRPARGLALNDVYASVAVVVGDSCCAPDPGVPGHARRYWSDRVPETLGRGGFLVHPWVEGIDESYTDGEHLRLYEFGEWTQLFAIIDHYLEHPDEAAKIAAAGQAHVRANHTYTNRARTILDTIASNGGPIASNGRLVAGRAAVR